MAYTIKGLPDWAYDMQKVDMRTYFPEMPPGWNPWERLEDAQDILRFLDAKGVKYRLKEYSSNTSYSDLADDVKRAIVRHRLPKHTGAWTMWRCAVLIPGCSTRWAVVPLAQEAICRAFLWSLKQKDLEKRWSR